MVVRWWSYLGAVFDNFTPAAALQFRALRRREETPAAHVADVGIVGNGHEWVVFDKELGSGWEGAAGKETAAGGRDLGRTRAGGENEGVRH